MKRKSGVLMHISSLWGEYSEGSFGNEAKEWIDFLKDCGFSIWQVLPFCMPDEFNSPYKSFSTFSGNLFFIDLPWLHKQGLITDEELMNAKQKTPYVCEFERLKEERFTLLSKAADRFNDWDKADEFFKYNPYTDKFCEYMALKESNKGLPWQQFTVTEPDSHTLAVWRFIQYIFFTQWAEIKEYANSKGISIIGDIPIYVDIESSDIWSCSEQFQLTDSNEPAWVAGVPPDYFCPDGQKWGNPLYDWDKMKADGYKWWCDRIKFQAAIFDGIRIDHFRGLDSYYAIPASDSHARNGKWHDGPGLEFVETIKKAAGNTMLIAEDLGVITERVEKLVKDSNLPGMRVLQFGFLSDTDSPHLPHNYINNSIAYTGTHDNNTLLGYVWELDDSSRRKLLDYCGFEGDNWDRCYDEILRTVFASHAGILILPVQDLLLYGADTRLNTPGKCDGNWSFRITKEQLSTINKEKFRKWNALYER